MNNTAIEWCDSTWNPVTGCLRGCEYCYARGIAKRFEGVWDGDGNRALSYLSTDFPKEITGSEWGGLGLKYRVGNDKRGEPKLIDAPYPYGFHPTLHRQRLEVGLSRWKKPRTIFVGSMTDLFGTWVPDEWIRAVFEACEDAPQHRYLFLTKNPTQYWILKRLGMLPNDDNYWFGFTATNQIQLEHDWQRCGWMDYNTFASIEPIHGPVDISIERRIRWVIVGAETGNRRDKVIPERKWIKSIAEQCREANVPVFMKSSLAKIWGESLIQEYPWEV